MLKRRPAISCQQLSAVERLLFEFPAGILTVDITLNVPKSAVSLVSFKRLNVLFLETEFLSKDSLLFPFQFRSLRGRMSEYHLDACRIVDAYFRLNLEW